MGSMDKARFIRISILPLLLVATSAAGDTVVTSMRLKGNTATALFVSRDPLDPCIENLVSVVSADLIEKDEPGGKTVFVTTQITVIQQDFCSSITLFNGEGASTAPPVQVAGDLSSASITTTVPVLDGVHRLTHTFQVNLRWQATSAPETTKFREDFTDKERGIKIKTMSKSTMVQATATGTVTGLGENFTPEPSDSATIQKSNDGSHIVQREL
jgi:hypothetical protein